ncbi:MAG: hypothetical protein WC756_16980 [Taibaiella sp.]|jgi:hypothetical protein
MNPSIAINNQFTKEAIKLRMLQHAANLWGVKNPNSLDPFVRLLIEAFSTEIYRAANETQNIEGRILDKIAHMLTPNLLTASKPAHAIMQAVPLHAHYSIHPHTKFSFQKRLMQNTSGSIRNEEIQINFSPTSSSNLVRGKVAFIANSYQIFSMDNTGFKQPLLRTAEALPWATCWLGLQLDKEVHHLHKVPLYFDFPSYETNAWIYQLLSLSKLFYKDQEIAVTPGRAPLEADENNIGKDIFRDHDLMEKLHEEIEQYYNDKFITIDNCELDRNEKGYPDEIKRYFTEAQLNGKIPSDLVWIKIKFPPNYNYEMLSNCHVSLNSFPVSNRSLLTSIYSYKGLNNILPLRTETYERFLAVRRVADAGGREYNEIPYSLSLKERAGFYSIRHGGVERFDQRSAHDLITYLLELTRDEVAAFSSMDQTFIRTSLEGLTKQLKQIQNKTAQLDKHVKQSPSYLVIEPIDAEENIQIDYWVTQGIEANNIRPGTGFICQNNPDIEPQDAVLLSESFGGREPLQAGERLDMYRYALGSRNRLITQEDIRNFCKSELGKKLKEVKFSKGLELSPHPKQGYIRILEVHLVAANIHELNREEWDHIANMLLIKIRNLSPDGVNYKVVVDEEPTL